MEILEDELFDTSLNFKRIEISSVSECYTKEEVISRLRKLKSDIEVKENVLVKKL